MDQPAGMASSLEASFRILALSPRNPQKWKCPLFRLRQQTLAIKEIFFIPEFEAGPKSGRDHPIFSFRLIKELPFPLAFWNISGSWPN